MIHGIDVASYQSATPHVGDADFVFVKASEGTSYVNPKRHTQAAAARKAGAVTGWYHFARPGDVDEQAAYFLAHCDLKDGDILAIDWEHAGVSSSAKDDLLKKVKKLAPHHKVVLYCNSDYWLHRDASGYCGDGLWVADYSHPAGKPPIKAPWLFHQYDDKPVTDQNVGAFASRDALAAWATGGEDHPAPHQPLPIVDLSKLVAAAKADPHAKQGHRTYEEGTRLVEAALHAENLLDKRWSGDGSFGWATVRAYGRWQKRCGVGSPWDGIPGLESLILLGRKHGFRVVA